MRAVQCDECRYLLLWYAADAVAVLFLLCDVAVVVLHCYCGIPSLLWHYRAIVARDCCLLLLLLLRLMLVVGRQQDVVVVVVGCRR